MTARATNPTDNRTMGEIIAARFSRRGFLQGFAGGFGHRRHRQPDGADHRRRRPRRCQVPPSLSTRSRPASTTTHHVAAGYDADVLLRWGDPLFADCPGLRPGRTSRPKPRQGSSATTTTMSAIIPLDGSAEHGLLVVNHEYTNPHLMFPGIVKIVEKDGKKSTEVAPLSKEQVDVEMAAHGGTIVEIRKDGGKWQVVRDGKLNRRITANTEMAADRPGRRP